MYPNILEHFKIVSAGVVRVVVHGELELDVEDRFTDFAQQLY